MKQGTAWAQLLDDAVADVFRIMLGRTCTAYQAPPTFSPSGVAATVAFSGAIEGRCALFLSDTSAARLAESFLGPAADGWDTTIVEDAVGELCNMIAGGWKTRLGAPEYSAGLAVPVIARAQGPSNQIAPCPTETTRRAYASGDSLLVVDLSWTAVVA